MATPPLIYVLNGPNLNLLGLREPEIYGPDTLDDIGERLEEHARGLGVAIDMRQSNHEGHLIDWLHEAQARGAKAVILNAGGFTHTSVALLDALNAAELPVVEVHLSNIYKRESFRHHSYISPAAVGVIAGLGVRGYALALQAMAEIVHVDNEGASA